MNYKSMFLIALLLPAFCYSQNNKESVKTISDAQYKKILELKEISKRIKTSSEFIRTWGNEQFDDQLGRAIGKEAKLVEADRKTGVVEADKKIRIYMLSFKSHLMKALHGEGTFDHDLSKELFDWDTEYVDGIFDQFKFAWIDVINEYYLLEYHVGCYQECLNELIEMSKKSANLKQEV